LIKIGSKTAEKNSAQTNKQANRHYENIGHLAVNQKDPLNGFSQNWPAALPITETTEQTTKWGPY